MTGGALLIGMSADALVEFVPSLAVKVTRKVPLSVHLKDVAAAAGLAKLHATPGSIGTRAT